MTPENFDQTLREFIYRQPFQPFLVELDDGRTLEINRPAVAFGGGTAGFISNTDGLVGFSWENVRHFKTTIRETA
jgi:hypothetical protein